MMYIIYIWVYINKYISIKEKDHEFGTNEGIHGKTGYRNSKWEMTI